jgi:cupin fold WbuC family metalloprotein
MYSVKIFDNKFFESLTSKASVDRRRRQHLNIHDSYRDPCQRLFNAIEPGSYIRPHKHAADPRDELLIAIRGAMALVTFNDEGAVHGVLRLAADGHGGDAVVGTEVPANVWHTVVALESGSVLLEVKAGPFDPNQPKNLAAWAPEEGTQEASTYLRELEVEVAKGTNSPGS